MSASVILNLPNEKIEIKCIDYWVFIHFFYKAMLCKYKDAIDFKILF